MTTRVTTAAALLLALAALQMAGCGYRPLAAGLPDSRRSVRVRIAQPWRTDDPQLATMLSTDLCQELGRAGIRADTASRAETELRATILSLSPGAPVLGARAVVARDLRLRLELSLLDRDGKTLWRSGLVEVQAPWALGHAGPLAAEASRRKTVAALSQIAARRAVLLLTATGQPGIPAGH